MTDREKLELMGRYFMSLMEGDTHMIDEALELLETEGIIDADHEVIYADDE